MAPPLGDVTVSYHKCESCGKIAESHLFMIVTKSTPLGSNNPFPLQRPASFKVIRKRRTVPTAQRKRSNGNSSRRIIRNQGFIPTEDPVPLLAGKPDRDLEMLLSEHNGILVSCMDDNVDGQDVSYTNYTQDSE